MSQRKYNLTFGHIIIAACIVGLVMLILAVWVHALNVERGEQRTLLEGCFVFEDGWELVSRDTNSHDTAPQTVYICRNLETGMYRQCTPQSVECGE